MSFPHQRRNWKRFQPRDLREALRGCKDYARERKRLSVERIADLMGVSADCLYKWLADARMPLASVQLYEHICGAHFVTDYLAGGADGGADSDRGAGWGGGFGRVTGAAGRCAGAVGALLSQWGGRAWDA